MKTDTGKKLHRIFIPGPLFQTEKKRRKETAITSGELTPKNRHCLRGLDGKYGQWAEILRDILNGKLKIVQNRKRAESDTENDDNDDDDDEEMPEDTGDRVYDTSVINRVDTVVYLILEIFGDNKIINVCNITGPIWNVRKGTPLPQTTHKTADFMPGEITPPGTYASCKEEAPRERGKCNTVDPEWSLPSFGPYLASCLPTNLN